MVFQAVSHRSESGDYMSKSLMILGTSSGAGKSTIATGLCRIFTQDGYKTAPFKAQNMSNNAYSFPDGRQMAKSQAIAAFACKLEPDPDMNPILLKFASGSIEVILRGASAGRMNSSQYNDYRSQVGAPILEAYQHIAKACEIVVLEGAGSPVEMNIKELDVVNLNMAKRVQAPALLVADIDRGGVFASVYGTLMLLAESERALIKGIIINRIRGQEDRFQEVSDKMEEITGLPVVGMVHYLDLKLEDEDGLIDPGTGLKKPQSRSEMELEFDHLAAELRNQIDLAMIYKIIEDGV